MRRRMILLAIAMVALAGCRPDFAREAEESYRSAIKLREVTEPKRDVDIDGDGAPDDPAVTRVAVEQLWHEQFRGLRALVRAAGGNPDAVEVEARRVFGEAAK